LLGTLLIALILDAIGIFYPTGWKIAAGSFFIIAGSLAFWLSFTQVFNEYWRSNLLPWWPYIHKLEDHKKGSAGPYFPKVAEHIHSHRNHKDKVN